MLKKQFLVKKETTQYWAEVVMTLSLEIRELILLMEELELMQLMVDLEMTL